ncbi:recombinase family protein [Clostridioides difficile]|uniref:recombinase family protein n=1 Tax=Clostridioides difficile TaxID=1496 RepID=UPI0021CD6B40|nr:recombinase family protein [Clostridioides difficile]
MDKIKRVALYIRVSTEEQVLHGDSIRTQTEALQQYAKDNSFIVVDKYVDEGYSATNLNRPNLRRMIEDIKENKIDLILLTKLDRFSRGVKNFYKILDTLEKHKCDWKTILEDYDSSTASGRLHINIMLSFAENEASQTSERIKFVFNNKIQKKEVISGKVPFGYRIENKHLVIKEDEAEIVRESFDTYIKFSAITKTIQHINSKFNMKHMYKWMQKLLKNKIYIGIYERENILIEDYCEPIISNKQFYFVQSLLKKNKRVSKNKFNIDYIFAGMIVCNSCGRKMSGVYGLNPSGTLYLHYRCSLSFGTKLCSNTSRLGEKKVEAFLLENVKTELYNAILKHESNNKKSSNKNDTEKLKNKLKKQIEKLQDLYFDDLISKDNYRFKYKKLNDDLIELENKENEEKVVINDLQKMKSFLKINFEDDYVNMSSLEKRTLWTSLIDRIEVQKDGNLVIKFL